jgi:adenylate kinase
MLNIVLFGPPGAGKGTQSQKLIDKYNLVHLSTGDLLRSQIAEKTELGLKAQEYMNKGELVPDAVVIGMIADKIKSNSSATGFIFDGFPRTVAQAEALDTMLKENGTAISGMVALEVDEEELTKRIILRGQTAVPPRPDDQDETLVRKRVSEYNTKTKPVADFYAGQGKFASIYGIGEIEEIFGQICSVVDKLPK